MSYHYEEDYLPNTAAPAIGPEAIAILCLYLPSQLDAFPRLEKLWWATSGSTAPILPFLSPHIKSLEVELVGDSHSVDDFFHALAGRTPNLKVFSLTTSTPAIAVEESLREAIGSWKKLESLMVPPYYLRPSITKVVASLPDLTVLEQCFDHHTPYDEAAMLKKLPEDAFPRLQTFGFNINPASARKFVQKHPAFFTRLTEIIIDSADGVGHKEVLELAGQLGKGCVGLTRISLNFCLGLIPQTEATSPLSFQVWESLFPCRKLKMLEIGHPYPLTFNETDVERMAVAWPNMVVFVVGNEPDFSQIIPGDMGNSPSILSTFARHFPKMERLGLFFTRDQTVRFSGDFYPEFEFHQLESLCVGVSAVPGGSSQEMGFLIASLCKAEPAIFIGASEWYIGRECPEWAEYQRQWEEASKSLELAMRTKHTTRMKTLVAES